MEVFLLSMSFMPGPLQLGLQTLIGRIGLAELSTHDVRNLGIVSDVLMSIFEEFSRREAQGGGLWARDGFAPCNLYTNVLLGQDKDTNNHSHLRVISSLQSNLCTGKPD